jgi:hypothetical protein
VRTFTLAEAQSMLPVLESLLKRASESKATAESLDAEFQLLGRRIFLAGGTHVDIVATARKRGEREAAIRAAKDSLAEIDAIGVQVKDIDKGLLDFPCKLDGETVLLCWKMGESTISHWHTLEGGFVSRKPIDHRFTGGKPQ